MAAIFASLQTLLPLSVDDDAFRSSDERAKIRAALARLASRTNHLSEHVAGGDRRISFLASSLSRESTDAIRHYEQGRFDHAQYLIRGFAEFCVACHTRVPSRKDSPLAQGFVSAGALAKLSSTQRATLQVATRRFDDALVTYEMLFARSDIRPAELLAPLSDYLRVAIRVKGDLDRARVTLQRFAKRPDLWSILRDDVESWLSAIELYAGAPKREPTLARAHALLEDARARFRFPMDERTGLIQQYLASSELHRYLEHRAGESGRDVAEAYYLLGLTESQNSFNILVPASNFYLETAIRLAPHDPIGRQAFELYEERAVLGWTGSSGTRMPADVRNNLEALRQLVRLVPARASEMN